jgi:hypothetical protein
VPFVLLAIVWFCWGLSYPATAIALRGFDVVTCRVAVQVLGAGALLLQAILCRRLLRIAREAWPDLTFVTILYMTIMPLGMNLGVYLAGPDGPPSSFTQCRSGRACSRACCLARR